MFPLDVGYTWSHGDLKLIGVSMAGICTSLVFPGADVCFDVGQGLPFQFSTSTFLISHGHMDHASGLPYVIGQKAMRGLKNTRVFLPHALEPALREILHLWARIEDHEYPYAMTGVGPGDEIPLKGNYVARVFPTFHRVPSQGYLIVEKKKRLLPAYRGQSPKDIGLARHRGEVVEERFDDPALAFTGDTGIEFLVDPAVRRARVLVMEVTYFDQRKSVAEARRWGHIHLDELIPKLDEISSEKIVLIHTSARYSRRDLERILAERVPAEHRGRVELFPRPD